jgi:hypothetical protein
MTKLLAGTLNLIAGVSVLSGAIQVVAPAFVFGLVRGKQTPTSLLLFSIIGMFMLFLGLLMFFGLHVAYPRYPLVLACLQKFGASAAVFVGITKSLFGTFAWAVSGFDFLTGTLLVLYLVRARPPR